MSFGQCLTRDLLSACIFQKLITINLLKLVRPQVVHVSNFIIGYAYGLWHFIYRPSFIFQYTSNSILNLKKDDNVWNLWYFISILAIFRILS